MKKKGEGCYCVVNKKDYLLYNKSSENSIFKNKDNSKYIFVNVGGSTYIKVPVKTYNQLLKIDKMYVRSRLFQYVEDWDYDWDEIMHWNEVLYDPNDILSFFYKMNKIFISFCVEYPCYMNIPSELRYKKIKIKFNNGETKKLSMNKFDRKFLKGICFM